MLQLWLYSSLTASRNCEFETEINFVKRFEIFNFKINHK
jgi:hypothetical protein